MISDWQMRATTNALQISSWWTENPEANIGIACEVSNLIVVDLDTSKGSSVPDSMEKYGVNSGEDLFLEIYKQKKVNPPSNTYTVVTPSGGENLYFFDDSQPINPGVEVNGLWKVDIRSRRGYIVAAGSRLTSEREPTIREYSAINSVSDIETFPEWLRQELSNNVAKPSERDFAKTKYASTQLTGSPRFSREFAEQVLREMPLD